MATVATYVERESADLEFVGTTDAAAAAAESVRTDGWDCLVVGGDLSAADRRALVDAAACPIVSFTTAGRDADADPVVAAAALVLEKGTDERILAMLVNKATQFAGTDRTGTTNRSRERSPGWGRRRGYRLFRRRRRRPRLGQSPLRGGVSGRRGGRSGRGLRRPARRCSGTSWTPARRW